MKNLLRFSVLLLAAGLILGLAGCQVEEDKGSGVAFDNFTNPSIYVAHNRNQKLVAFKNAFSPKNLVSGIPAYAQQHGLKRDPALFSKSEPFVLLVVTEADYIANKSNLGALDSKVYARVFAFYNHTGTNNNVFEISSKIGGQGRFTIVNDTKYNVEFRSGGPTGQILGYAAAGITMGNVINLDLGDYEIYPVYKLFNQQDQELYSVVPKFIGGALDSKPFFQPYAFSNAEPYHTFNVSSIEAEGSFNLSSGGVYIRVINNASIAVRLWDGTTPRFTTTEGNEYINSQREAVYTIEFLRGNDGAYPASRQLPNIRIGAGSNMIVVENEKQTSAKTTYELDCEYSITVTGTSVTNLAIGDPVNVRKIDLDALFGLND
jgi:hypothetical protein